MPRAVIALLLSPLVVAAACATTGGKPMVKAEEPAIQAHSIGNKGRDGNLLAIQAYADSTDYASAWTLSAKLENYLEVAHKRRWLNKKTIVVLPDHWATWMLASDEAPEVYQARTQEDALKLLHNAHFFDVALRWVFADGDRVLSSLYGIKGQDVARQYQKMMMKVAQEYKVTLVGGTLVLPDPQVKDGDIVVNPDGPLRRCAFVFGPDGFLLGPPTCKAFLREAERETLESRGTGDLQVYQTRAGPLGVLIGDDAWQPASYTALKEKGAKLVVALHHLPVRSSWGEPWTGYAVIPAPDDVATDDVQGIPLRAAMTKYALPGRLSSSGAEAGVTTYLRGSLWDQRLDGQTFGTKGEQIDHGPYVDAPVLLNLWLGDAPAPEPVVAPAEAAPVEAAPAPEKKKKKKKNKRGKRKRGKRKRR